MTMFRIIAATALLWAAVPACARDSVTMTFECRGALARATQPSDFWGSWDVVWDVGGRPNIGVLSLGIVDGALTGTIALPAGVVALRTFLVNGRNVELTVASPQGDVRFNGSLAPDARRMCGVVTYHDGRTMPMLAEKRASPRGALGG